MPGLSQKPNASFFRKIATGAVGTERVLQHLRTLGHEPVVLEPGADDVRIWQGEKPKGFRIPDILCLDCGRRIESRAKTDKPELTLSHSDTAPDRHWDYGLGLDDWVAIAVCAYQRDANGDRREENIYRGHLDGETAYWYERSRIPWTSSPVVSYFPVAAFKNAGAYTARRKGVTEGSETQISWDAKFATAAGTVVDIKDRQYNEGGELIGARVDYRPNNGGRLRWAKIPWRGDPDPAKPIHICVNVGEHVDKDDVLISEVAPVDDARCPGRPKGGHPIGQLLESESIVDRYVGLRLARALGDETDGDMIARLAVDTDEPLQVRLQALLYAITVMGWPGYRLVNLVQSRDVAVALQTVSTLSSLADGGAEERRKGHEILENVIQGGSHYLQIVGQWTGPLARSPAPYAPPRAFPLIQPASVSEDVRCTALWVLGRLGGGLSLDLILRELANPSYFVRAEALAAMAGPQISVAALSERLLNPNEYSVTGDQRAGIAEAAWRRVRRGRDAVDEWCELIVRDGELVAGDTVLVELLGRLLPLASDDQQTRAQEVIAAEDPALAAAVEQVARMEVSWTRDHIDPSYRWM